MRLVNLVPHSVDICNNRGRIVRSIPPSGNILRVKIFTPVVDEVELTGRRIDVVETSYGEAELPPPIAGTFYIVSSVVIAALKSQGIHRPDFIAPDTSPKSAVYDQDGTLIGVRRFTR